MWPHSFVLASLGMISVGLAACGGSPPPPPAPAAPQIIVIPSPPNIVIKNSPAQ